MASSSLHTRSDGSRFYEIRVHLSRTAPTYKKRWDVPEGWSDKAVKRQLAKEEAEFERACKDGEVLTRAQAKEKQRQEEEEKAKLRTVADYANNVYIPTKNIAISENTRSTYQMNLDKHILPVIGNMLLVDIPPAVIKKLLLDYQAAGHAHASCVKLYNILNGIFDMAFMDDSIPMNPMLKVKRPSPRKEDNVEDEAYKAYTLEETRQILSCLQQEPLKWQTYVLLSLDTGARRGEICALKWTDINWDTNRITIARNLQYTPAKGVYETSPKNGKARDVDIGENTASLLRKLREEQAASCISPYVFTQDGTQAPIHPQSPTRFFHKFGLKHGINDFHPHKLRHTNASIAITNGADIASVSERLGHRDTAITLRMYVHANDESIRKAGEIVRNALMA